MSENEVQVLREQMNIMEKNLLNAISEVKLHLAEDFVTKEDLKDYKADQKWLVGIAAGIGGLIWSILSGVANWFKGS